MAQAKSDPAPNADPDRLRAIVQTEAQKAGTKAVLFGMWVKDKEILTMALGHSMTTVPATTDMHYRIGGIAETFMSTLLLMLVEQGRISLDDKISRWFPNLLAADQVTVRMLVANTAGYIDYVTVEDFLNLQLSEPFRTFTDDELINYSVRDGKMNFAPGTSQQYSHTDNVILGQVIQRATGQSMKELYDRNIFGPMDMKEHTVSGQSGDPEPGAARIHEGTQGLRGLHLLEPVLGLDARFAYLQHSRPGQMGPDLRDRTSDFAGALPGANRSDLGGQRQEQAGPLFCLWICRLQRLARAKPQHQWIQRRLRLQSLQRRHHRG